MHWGERRYQNKDGTLTPEGRERYGIGNPKHDPEIGPPEEPILDVIKRAIKTGEDFSRRAMKEIGDMDTERIENYSDRRNYAKVALENYNYYNNNTLTGPYPGQSRTDFWNNLNTTMDNIFKIKNDDGWFR